MPSSCGKCSEDITVSKEAVTCTDCKLSYHPACTRIKSLDALKKMSGGRKLKWKCDECKLESVSTATSRSDQDQSEMASVLDAISELRKEISANFDTVNEKLQSAHLDMNTIKADIGELKADLGSLKTENAKVSAELQSLKTENQSLKQDVSTLQSAVRDLEQYSRVNNLVITGVPVTEREGVYNILSNIAAVIGVEFNIHDISVAHRLYKRRDDPRPPPIVARFVSREVKNQWLTAKRNKKTISASELRGNLGQQQIYINEHLTPHTRAIFNKAREQVKTKILHQTWTRDCKVFVRKTHNSNPLKITTIEELS